MLTYLILHYNRPYFLDLIFQIFEKYRTDFPSDTRFLIADEGSDEVVRESLIHRYFDSPIGFSIIWNHPHQKDSCCRLIKKSLLSLQDDPNGYTLWSEDDFLYCPQPVILPPEEAKGEDLLDNLNIPYGMNTDPNSVITSSLTELMLGRTNIVQISRPIKNNVYPHDKCGYFSFLNHKKMLKYYYTNWPYITKNEYLIQLGKDMPDSGSIEHFEQFAGKWWNLNFGETTDFITIPQLPRFIHIGYSFSQQPSNNKNARRQKAFQDLQKLLSTNLGWEGINEVLCQKYFQRKFQFNIEEIEKLGLGVSMRKTLENL